MEAVCKTFQQIGFPEYGIMVPVISLCFTNPEALKHLYKEFQSKGVEILNGPHWSEGWSEMSIRDNNGYCIAFGA
ncbi:hypothetical protein [Paenibacillus phytorum]|uniref:hypothetical protein n=1 Tax=Paenibacillus phytorum TaxID=2654977 RepID=UPI001492360F|nr:hypothetical protein [Paenibacillus phytorum]